MTTVPVVSAGAPLPVPVDSLARAAWLGLDTRAAQGVRAVLRGLAVLLPPKSASGRVTVAQVADASGRSLRRARQVLQVMEAVGLITWTRGDILAGGRRPSLIRVSKKLLAALVTYARRRMPGRLARRAAEFAKRLAETLRARTIPARKRSPRVVAEPGYKPVKAPTHGEMNAPLPPLQGEGKGGAGPTVPAPLPKTGTMLNQPRPKTGSRWREVAKRIHQLRGAQEKGLNSAVRE